MKKADEIKVKPISKIELARKIEKLDLDNGVLDFWAWRNEDGYGVGMFSARFIFEFDAWVIFVNMWGGGLAHAIDYAPHCGLESEIERLANWIHDYCNYIGTHQLYVRECE